MMLAAPAPFPALGVDCVTVLTADSATALRSQGIRFACRYLGSLTPVELTDILAAGMMVSPVTYADQFDGAASVAELRALGIPLGVTVWLDVEGVGTMVPAIVIAKINTWAYAVSSAGYQPGLYVGANGVLSAAELYALNVVRYWRSMSLVPEPACGFCMTQLQPTTMIDGVSVDVDVVGHDYRGRLPTMVGLPPSAIGTLPPEAATAPDIKALPRQP